MTGGRRSRRSYSAGEWGRNRVRVFPDRRTGVIQIEWREGGRRLTRSLRHRDWARAKEQADEFAASLVPPEPRGEAEPGPLTLEAVFRVYAAEVTPAKSPQSRAYDRAAMRMFLGFFGKDRVPGTLSKRDWDRFIVERRSGRVGRSGRPVGDRTVERDLKFLLAVLNWAANSRDEEGNRLVESNPLRGLKAPAEKNPARVILTEAEYKSLLRVSSAVDWRFRVALVLAHETGHRIGAIRQLRWSDIDLEGEVVLWRSEHEKTGHEHTTPLTPAAVAVLTEARRRNPGIGYVPLLPAPMDPSRSVSHPQAGAWWKKAERLAGLEPARGRGWHALRRKFASDLMDQPLKVLCELGGWKTAQTMLQCYQQADQRRLREALEHRRKARS
ncbi:MAG: site-specific integrase [Gammaproteobacteria bacterium]|nr:site-specific integrase [Gammaproteobacteria bacterium]MDE0247779.1 site-specific integrase [Gammaproteobacteria bacterium]